VLNLEIVAAFQRAEAEAIVSGMFTPGVPANQPTIHMVGQVLEKLPPRVFHAGYAILAKQPVFGVTC
jgi:hypothetical protein